MRGGNGGTAHASSNGGGSRATQRTALSERLLTRVMDWQNGRQLKILPYGRALPDPLAKRDYTLYAHVPFCERLCPYCSFNRYPFQEDHARRYFRTLREEMRIVADQGFDFSSLYIGGGTPTILLDELCATIDLAGELFAISEVSCETNPNHLRAPYLEALAPRVKRLSVGVQSFDQDLLLRMERYGMCGSSAKMVASIQEAAATVDLLNVDLIFNFPSQTEAMLRRDLALLKESGCQQATAYPLMAPAAVARTLAKSVGRVDYRRERRFYDLISEELSDTFEPASAWTFSRISEVLVDEYIVDHEEYVGVGSGAFSFLGGVLYVQTFSLRDYRAAVTQGRGLIASHRAFSPRDRMRYRMLMGLFGLRLDKRRFREDFGISVSRALPVETAFLRASGALATDTADEATLTAGGRYLLVAMMREFFLGVDQVRKQARAAVDDDELAELWRPQHLTVNDVAACRATPATLTAETVAANAGDAASPVATLR